jgi:hypothetical protein
MIVDFFFRVQVESYAIFENFFGAGKLVQGPASERAAGDGFFCEC